MSDSLGKLRTYHNLSTISEYIDPKKHKFYLTTENIDEDIEKYTIVALNKKDNTKLYVLPDYTYLKVTQEKVNYILNNSINIEYKTAKLIEEFSQAKLNLNRLHERDFKNVPDKFRYADNKTYYKVFPLNKQQYVDTINSDELKFSSFDSIGIWYSSADEARDNVVQDEKTQYLYLVAKKFEDDEVLLNLTTIGNLNLPIYNKDIFKKGGVIANAPHIDKSNVQKINRLKKSRSIPDFKFKDIKWFSSKSGLTLLDYKTLKPINLSGNDARLFGVLRHDDRVEIITCNSVLEKDRVFVTYPSYMRNISPKYTLRPVKEIPLKVNNLKDFCLVSLVVEWINTSNTELIPILENMKWPKKYRTKSDYVYRGMEVSDIIYKRIVEEDKTIKLKDRGVSSWSTDPDVAKNFTDTVDPFVIQKESKYTDNIDLLRLVTLTNARKIIHFSNEKEVLVKDDKYTTSVSKDDLIKI